MDTIRKIKVEACDCLSNRRSRKTGELGTCPSCKKPLIKEAGYRVTFDGDKTPHLFHKNCYEEGKLHFRFFEELNKGNSSHDSNINAKTTIDHSIMVDIPMTEWKGNFGLRFNFATEKCWSLRPLGRNMRLVRVAVQKSNYGFSERSVNTLLEHGFKIRINGELVNSAEEFTRLTKKTR